MKHQELLSSQRIEILDIIRGFALWGILLVNMEGFVVITPDIPAGDSPVDYFLQTAFSLFIEKKFVAIFSILFGVGFYIFLQKLEKRTKHIYRLFTWRMVLLFFIGTIHSFFWFGDILHVYAISGVFMLLFYKCKNRTLLCWIVFFFLINYALVLKTDVQFMQHSNTNIHVIGNWDNHLSTGSVQEVSTHQNNKNNLSEIPLPLLRLYAVFLSSSNAIVIFPFILLGFYLGRKHFFVKMDISRIKKLSITCAFLSFPLIINIFLIKKMFSDDPSSPLLIHTAESITSISLSMFYISIIMLLSKNKIGNKLLNPLKATGRMALTNYLMQTVFGLSLFYIFGFSSYSNRLYGLIFALMFLFVQAFYSNVWFKTFQIGPVEWLWRSLTYCKLLPIKIKS